ncbi:MAG: sigma 54-interacting transcriptional regulator [Deltaproteobacteria bacterium]|nr:sigma 54-interacting transcriptional regulator [Deltaproteobacteria bacterium]
MALTEVDERVGQGEAAPVVVVGFFGTRLDRSGDRRSQRWQRWRPTLSIFQHEDRQVQRLELLVEPSSMEEAEVLAADIAAASPESEVVLVPTHLADPWDFEQVFATVQAYAEARQGLPGEDLLVHMTTGTHVAQICLFLLVEARVLHGRLLQTSPPRGRGPAGWTTIDLDLSRYDLIAQRHRQAEVSATAFLKRGIATRNAAFNALIDEIERVAIGSDAPILLTGPTGAGKSQLAAQIAALKRDRDQIDGRFIAVNCATLRGDQAMATLFGHERGAFTGANQAREGLLRAADGGLLFLDEVAELGDDEQAMLLHAIETGRFLPLGADDEVQSRFQLLVGTHRDLRQRVREGRFREDLLARIDLWQFHLPGLAERREDIEPNLDFELAQISARTGRRVELRPAARARFLRFAESAEARWQGNFRDLNAAVVRMATLAQSGWIGDAEVAAEIERLRQRWSDADADTRDDVGLQALLGERAAELDRFDRVQLAEVVRVCRQSPSLAAAGRTLFAASLARRTSRNDSDRLRKYLQRFDLQWHDVEAG